MEKGACCERGWGCSIILLIARILLGGGVLLMSAAAIALTWSDVRFFMATYGMESQALFLLIAGLVAFLVGFSILLGYWIRTVCAIGFCLSLPFLFYRLSFWGLFDYKALVVQTLFMSAAGMMGGLILFMLTGAGRLAIHSREREWSQLSEFRSWGMLLARLLIGGGYFLWHGIWKLVDWNLSLTLLEAIHIPAPHTVLWIMALIEIIGGLMILFGWHHRIAAWVLVAYTVIIAFSMHAFWNIHPNLSLPVGGEGSLALFINNVFILDRVLQQKLFFDMLGIIASLLLLTTCVGGRYSCEKRCSS